MQVGDPFTEKCLLIEACLELMATDAIVAIQDMGAAGLTSSSFEMASSGGVGIQLDLDRVPCREDAMTPYEMMLSESQERMLLILAPGRQAKAEAIFRKWELDFAVIGHLTDTGRMVLRFGGETVGDLPIDPLAKASPEYDRPWVATPPPASVSLGEPGVPLETALLQLLACPDLASRRWIWEQYDHTVMGDTVQRPGGDAAVVRVHGSNRGLAIATDCTPRYCRAHPETGGAQAVAEAWRNLNAVGALPRAVTDNMNFGNPERPEVMGQFVGCIQGMKAACLALDFPVVSGNVSLYNETDGRAILPTPAIGAVGVIEDLSRSATVALKRDGDALLLLGEARGHLGQSLYLREILGREAGPPPPVDLQAERRNGDFARRLIAEQGVDTCHDLSDGGLLVALAEMAMAGRRGATVTLPAGPGADPLQLAAASFGEDQARYLLAMPAALADRALQDAAAAGVPLQRIGTVGGGKLTVTDAFTISVDALATAHEEWLPGYMAL